MLGDKTLVEFLDEVASNSPTPGGGSVASLVGALAAALTSMVCQLTIGKKKYNSVEDEIKQVLTQSEKLRSEFTILAEKDSEAFNEVVEAYKMPKETEEEKQARQEAIQTALKRAILVPLDVLQRTQTMAELCRTVAQKGNENAVSDAGASAYLTRAAAEGASLNVLVNLVSLTDHDFKAKVKDEQAKILRKVRDIVNDVEQIVLQKL